MLVHETLRLAIITTKSEASVAEVVRRPNDWDGFAIEEENIRIFNEVADIYGFKNISSIKNLPITEITAPKGRPIRQT